MLHLCFLLIKAKVAPIAMTTSKATTTVRSKRLIPLGEPDPEGDLLKVATMLCVLW